MSKTFEKMQKLAFGKVVTPTAEPLTENTLREKIKELVHSSLGEAKKKKDEEELTDVAPQEDVPTEEPTDSLEPTDAGVSMDMGGAPDTGIDIDPKVKSIQDLLQKAYANAKALGDEKLMVQIGNTITMVVRNQVLGGQMNKNA